MSSRRGVVLLVIALSAVGFLLLVVSLRMRRPAYASSATVLVWDVPATIGEDQPPPGPFSPRFWRRPRMTVFDVLETLRAARDDDHVKALVLHVRGINWGWAKVCEVRDALREFRQSGKPVYASIEGGGEPEYLLASGSSRIGMPPAASLELDGLRASALFLRGTFDKLGVRPNFLSVGRFKSAVESYTRTGMSDPARESMTALLGDTYDTFLTSLAADRHASSDSVRAWMDRGPFTAEGARALELVDSVLYTADLDSLAMRRAGRGASLLKFPRYASGLGEGGAGPHLAIVTVSGDIGSGRSRSSPTGGIVAGSETIIEALQRARTRRSIRAVVLRIDSPGGDADAADAMWHEVWRLARAKPLVVSMSDLAASGGYYIAVPAQTIVAEPTTITGSIGVFGGKFNVLGLYQKLGMNIETVVTGPRAEMLSPFKDFSPEEERIYANQMQGTYHRFLKLVSDGRHMPVAAVDSVAQGHVWSGARAVRLGLADQLGGLEVAIDVARKKAGIPKDADVVIERLPELEPSFFQRFLGDFFADDDADEANASALIDALAPLRQLGTAAFASRGAIWTLMPYAIVIR
ncbi:MAG TPA: signal peptide peptidase SppA [Candidatus Sulfotelmatobacter sp.]|nr:signal peptide peptidase SppA [Candidatus Sulfotelmatobacter sp.]